MAETILTIGLLVVGLFSVVVLFGAPYVPSKPRDVRKVFTEVRSLKASDVLVDIGSGDGLVLRIAADLGVRRAVGYELNPILALTSWLVCLKYRTIRVKCANFYRQNVPDDTTVVYTFGESRDIAKMAEYVQQQANRIGKSIDFVSYAFELPNRQPIARNNVHMVYRIKPLQ